MLYKGKYELDIRGVLKFPADITEIPDEEFLNDKNISIVVFNKNIKQIGVNCFKKCTNLSEIFFGECNIKILSHGCFEDCFNLSKIDNWPQSLEKMGDRCFAHTFKLKKIPSLPISLKRFEKNSFAQDWFEEISFGASSFDMFDIEDISLACNRIVIGGKTFLLDNWDVDSVYILRRDENQEFIVWCARPIVYFFNSRNDLKLYKYYDKKSGEFTISYDLRGAKREIDDRLDSKLSQRAQAENWNLNTPITIKEYGIISHSCLLGITDWVNQNGFDPEQKYPIKMFLEYNSENERGYLFTEFVEKYVKK